MKPKKKNTYTIDGDIAIVDIRTKKHPHAEMIIDLDDWERIIELDLGRVSAHSDGRNVYARCYPNGDTVLIHRLLLPDSPMVDHISRDGLDNRRCNIRESDASANQRNARTSIRNTSGKTGVSWHSGRRMWRVRIGDKFMGEFHSKERAINCRELAEHILGYTSDAATL